MSEQEVASEIFGNDVTPPADRTDRRVIALPDDARLPGEPADIVVSTARAKDWLMQRDDRSD
ncbi:hypothetical protein O6W96_19470 [Sphingomonas faeni]